jgi:uncharacterized surface protein with fasciclin (FAS1) repeats
VRHVLKRNRGAIAVPAAMALALMACEADDNGDASPGIEEGDPDEQDEQALLPEGAFGDECQQLLVAADADEADTAVDADADAGDGGAGDDAFDAGDDAEDGVDDDAFDAEADDDAFDAEADGDTTGGTADDDAMTDEDDEFSFAPAATETDEDGDETDATDDGLEADDEADGQDEAIDDDADGQADVGTDVGDGPEDALRQMTVLEALEALPDFDRFTSEIAGTQLETDLEGEGDVTVFAPLDEAFDDEAGADDAATDDGVEDDAFEDDEADGTGTATDADADVTGGTDMPVDERVIAHHLHPEAALSAQQLVDDESISTAAEDAGDLRITVDGELVSVDADESTALVVCANIETQDGTIHVVDEVLLPRETDVDAEADADDGRDTETDNGAEPDEDVGTDDDLDATDPEDDADAEGDLGNEADAEGDLGNEADDDGFDG